MKVDVKLVGNTMFLNKTFKEVYNLVSSNKMAFHSCILVNKDNLVFVLKEPKRLFTVTYYDKLYKFELQGEDGSVEVVHENNVDKFIEKMKLRQVF